MILRRFYISGRLITAPTKAEEMIMSGENHKILSEEQLSRVSGGLGSDDLLCKICGCTESRENYSDPWLIKHYICFECRRNGYVICQDCGLIQLGAFESGHLDFCDECAKQHTPELG